MTDSRFLVSYTENGVSKVALQDGSGTYKLNGDMASLDYILRKVPASELDATLDAAKGGSLEVSGSIKLPDHTQVWAAGVTYKISEEARERESNQSTIYTRVYSAERPELFSKSVGYEVVGNGDTVGIRYDATWSVPEPELTLVINALMEVIGFTIGNDMSSRDIEGANPLYLPQAKVYDHSCAIGPRIWLQPGANAWPDAKIHITIERDAQAVFEGETSTANLHRSLPELVDFLGRCKRFPYGVFLMTGTGVVPSDDFTLAANDVIRVRINPIGELVNTVQVVQTTHS